MNLHIYIYIYIYILHNLKPYKEYGESWKLMLKINKLIDDDNLILNYNIKYWPFKIKIIF